MKFKTLVLTAIIIAGVSFTSCEKDDTGEPRLSLKFKTITSPFPLTDLKSTQAAKELSFTSGIILLREVEFEVETENDSLEIEFEVEMNTRIDFATGETDPDISYIEIPAGTYEEMEVEIELQDKGDSPAIVLNGTYVDLEGTSHPVRFEYNSDVSFEIEIEGTFTFSTNVSALAQITIDPTAWFATVTNDQLASASRDDFGVIVISETQNPDIFYEVEEGLDLASEVEISL